MCYSAQIRADYVKFVRQYDASVSLEDFFHLYWLREKEGKTKVPRALDAVFLDDPAAAQLHPLIHAHASAEATWLEQELFAQRTRLNKTELALATKPTKKAADDQRIATNKIARAQAQLAALKHPPRDDDARIYPGYYAPVMVTKRGQRVIKPMRYQCRPCGKPADYDRKYPGTYNARRDNLEGFWKEQFGHTQGVAVLTAFHEHVPRHAA